MKLVLFDIDGTLIRSGGAGRRAFERAVAEVLGVSGALSNFPLGGKTDPLILDHVFFLAGKEQHPALVEEVLETYLGHLKVGVKEAEGYQVLDGVVALLDELEAHSDFALGLGTGNIERGGRIKLERAGLNHYFPTGGFGSDASARADVIAAGIKKSEAHFGVNFDCVWVVGDTLHDIHSARAVTAEVIAVATGSNSFSELEDAKPTCTVRSLKESRVRQVLLGE